MKVLSVAQCRSIWGGQTIDLNPYGQSNPTFSKDLKDKYSFQIAPESIFAAIQSSPSQSATLAGGSFKKKDGKRVQIALTLSAAFSAVDTRSTTDDGDEALEDLYQWLTDHYSLPGDFRKIFTKRYYVSNLNVSFSRPLTAINPKLVELIQSIGDIPGFGALPVEVGAIQFWTDTRQNPRPAVFRFERQVDTGMDENRYFVSAPLQTAQHLELLERFEKILG